MINYKNLSNTEKLSFLKRNYFFNYIYFYELDFKIRYLKKNIYRMNRLYNIISTLIKNCKFLKLNCDFLIFEISVVKSFSFVNKHKLSYLEIKFNSLLCDIPNFLHKSVNFGLSFNDNLEIKFFKSINRNDYKLDVSNDIELNKNYIDFELASQISSSGFVVIKDNLATLHRALFNYMVDVNVHKHNYKEILSPLCVNEKSMYNTGHFPKFYNDQFALLDTDLWLIPTAEVVLSNVFCNSTIAVDKLPIRLVSRTECFRKERGNYGSSVRGLIRQHQFDKVELVNLVNPKESYKFLDELVSHVEYILQKLDLSYRIISLCSYDTGFSSAKTYDLEVWLPKRKIYLEVSSCSNTESFQARKMNSKIKFKSGNNIYSHILNGSGLAVGRMLLAIMENYSDINGNVLIPEVLVGYMNGLRIINYS